MRWSTSLFPPPPPPPVALENLSNDGDFKVNRGGAGERERETNGPLQKKKKSHSIHTGADDYQVKRWMPRRLSLSLSIIR